MIFREGVLLDNVVAMATNMANFIIENNLDGIDIDWEYPGASISNTFTFIELILIYFYLFRPQIFLVFLLLHQTMVKTT